jgi:hypothetical protein
LDLGHAGLVWALVVDPCGNAVSLLFCCAAGNGNLSGLGDELCATTGIEQ